MKGWLKNPIVTRVLGALGAGVATAVTSVLTTGHVDVKAATATAATFVIYGSAHKAAEKAGQ